jgi:membrane protein implicated in regulation of membrane protease activity
MSYTLASKLRGCITQLGLLDEHFLSVQLTRPDVEPRKYDFDLRFANAKPVIVRHIAWFWLALAISLAALATSALWMLWPKNAADWAHPVPLTAVAALLAALCSVLMFLRRTTESLEFTSVHGGVTLVSVTGAIGSAREGKKFFVELIKSIHAAKAARPQPAHQFLRDEMREHHRLRELGVLTEEQYETSKSRILASH